MSHSSLRLARLQNLCREHWMIVFPLLSFLWLLIPYMAMPPVWDAREYWTCVQSATEKSFSLANFRCFGHPSELFMLLFGVTQYLSHGSILLLNALSMFLGACSIVAFYAIILFLFPRDRLLALLFTFLYAWNPVMLANTINFNPDSGILFFFVIFFAALLYRIRSLALLTGLFLCFTKEIGAPLLGLTVLVYLLFFITRGSESLRTKCWRLLLHSYLLVPILVFCVSIALEKYVYHVSPVWVGTNLSSSLFTNLLRIDFSSHRFLIALADVFVLHFAWVSSIVICIAAILWVWRFTFALPARVSLLDGERQKTLFVVVLTVLATYLLTSFLTFNNPRYYLSLYFLNILLFAVSLHAVFRRRSLKIACATIVALLTFVSIAESNDPVSMSLFGTVPFGSHQFYTLTAAAGDPCCGYGRDQLIYNLEYAKLVQLQDRVYAHIQPTNDTIIVTNEMAGYGFGDALDPHTFHRILQKDGIHPQYMNTAAALGRMPLAEKLFFIQYPNFDDTQSLAALRKVYPFVRVWEVEKDGYVLTVSEMSR